MKILRYVTGSLIILVILACDAFFCQTLFLKWFYLLIAAVFFALLRLATASTNLDRMLSFKAARITLVGFCALLSVSLNREIYLDIAVAWALQSFFVTLLLAKYFEGEEIDD